MSDDDLDNFPTPYGVCCKLWNWLKLLGSSSGLHVVKTGLFWGFEEWFLVRGVSEVWWVFGHL